MDLDNPNLRGLPYEVARAQIASLRTSSDPKARYQVKKQLLINLYNCGYTADDVRAAYGLIDHMMLLNQQFKKQLNQDIKEYEQTIAMPFVTSMEEAGIEKGIEKGEEKIIVKQLKVRFPTISDQHLQAIYELSSQQLEDLAVEVLTLQSLDDLEAWLDKQP